MKSLKYYIKIGVIAFCVILLCVEINNFFFGSHPKQLGKSYGPQSIHEILHIHLCKDALFVALSVSFAMFLAYEGEKFKSKQKRTETKAEQHFNDPILSKIIEDALKGKKATEDSESEVNDTENAEKEGSDVKN